MVGGSQHGGNNAAGEFVAFGVCQAAFGSERFQLLLERFDLLTNFDGWRDFFPELLQSHFCKGLIGREMFPSLEDPHHAIERAPRILVVCGHVEKMEEANDFQSCLLQAQQAWLMSQQKQNPCRW